MGDNSNILVNIHNFKTFLSRFYKVDFGKIKFIKFNDNHNRNLYSKYNSILDSMENEYLVGVKIKTNNVDLILFDDFNNTIVDDMNTSYGQCIGNFVVNKKIKPSDYTLFLIINECDNVVDNVNVLITQSFKNFLKQVNKNIHFDLLSVDKNIAYLNHSYFGNIENCFTLN